MKCNLRIVDDGTQLEIQPESDVEVLALRVWAEKFFEIHVAANGAYLIILANTPSIATERTEFLRKAFPEG